MAAEEVCKDSQEELCKEFQEKLTELNIRYQEEYQKLCQDYSLKSLDAQICSKLDKLIEKHVMLMPSVLPMNVFDYNNFILNPYEIIRIKQMFEKASKTND